MTTTLTLEEAVEFADNPEPRCPCVLLLDTSGSMAGERIAALNQGLRTFKDDLLKDPVAPKRVEIAVVTFDDEVNIVQDFVTADRFEPPTLEAGGITSMGAAIHTALDLIQERKERYKQSGVPYYRPWVFMITDGDPQGERYYFVEGAAERLRSEEASKRVVFHAVAVEGADVVKLGKLFRHQPLTLKGLDFDQLFIWLSRSMHSAASSKRGRGTSLPFPR